LRAVFLMAFSTRISLSFHTWPCCLCVTFKFPISDTTYWCALCTKVLALPISM
jgi:hypothetical protein